MFSRVWPLGLGFGLPATSAALTQLDINVSQALDAAAGGTYAPINRVVVGGPQPTPLEVQGTFLTQNLVATGVYELQGGGAMTGVHTFHVAIGATFDINTGAFLLAHGPATFLADGNSFQGDTTFTGSKTYVVASGSTWNFGAGSVTNFSNGPTFLNGASFNTGGAVGFAVPVTFATTVALQNVTTNTGEIVNSAVGRIRKRPRFSMPDANTTVGVTTGGSGGTGADAVNIETGSLTAARSLTITSSGAGAGSRIIVNTDNGAFAVTLKQDNGTAICDLKQGGSFAPAAACFRWVELEHNGGANGWAILRGHGA